MMKTADITIQLSGYLDFPYKFRGQVYNTPKQVVEITTVWTNDSLTVVRREDTKEVYVIHKDQGILASEQVEQVDLGDTELPTIPPLIGVIPDEDDIPF